MEPILLFIDETYLANESGKIQTVIPAPASIYQKVIVPQCRQFLAQLGPDAKEFKGGRVKRGNLQAYESFLRLFTNLSAIVADQSPLRSVMTLDGTSLEFGEPLRSVRSHILLALNRVGVTDAEKVATGFSKQLVWLKDHFTVIATRPFPNPLVLTFDNQYRYAELMQRQRAVVRNGNEITSFKPLEEILTVAANCLLQQWTEPMRLPLVQQMSFRESTSECGLQAADMFSNLYFNFVMSELGHVADGTKFKADLCRRFLPSLSISDELRSIASLVTLPNGQTSFELSDPFFGQQAILGPPITGLTMR